MNRTAWTAARAWMQSIRLGLLSLTIVLTLAPQGGAQSENGLIGHWKLDEHGPSELVADASPNQWHGTREASGAEGSVPGKLGQALRFPAAGTIRLDRHAAALGKLTDFTVSMWIQYDGGASRQLFTFSDGTTESPRSGGSPQRLPALRLAERRFVRRVRHRETRLDARHVVSRRVCQ